MPKFMIVCKSERKTWAHFCDDRTDAENYRMDAECGIGAYAEVYKRDEKNGMYRLLYA